MKYFVVHKSIYAVNIWKQSLIKLWCTPSAGAAAVSSIRNLVRKDLAELCGKQVAPKEESTNAPVLCRSQLGSSEMDIKSVGAAGLSQSGSQCPPENPSPFTYSRSKPFCGALRTRPVPAAVCWCSRPPMGMRVPCIPLCAPPSRAPHQGAGRCWPLAWPFFVSCAPTEEFT